MVLRARQVRHDRVCPPRMNRKGPTLDVMAVAAVGFAVAVGVTNSRSGWCEVG